MSSKKKERRVKWPTLPPGEYGNTSAYHPSELTNKFLGQLRTGTHALNPGGAVLLVREIDKLNAQIDKLVEEREAIARMIPAEEYSGTVVEAVSWQLERRRLAENRLRQQSLDRLADD